MGCGASHSPAATSPGGLVRHQVMIGVKDGTTEEQLNAIKDGLAALSDSCKYKSFCFSIDAKLPSGQSHPAGKNRACTWYADFASVEDYEAYAKDAQHQKVIAEKIKPVMAEGTRAAIQVKDGADEPKDAGIRHQVMIGLKDGTSPESVDAIEVGLRKLSAKCKYKAFVFRRDLMLESGKSHPAGKNRDCTWCADFATLEDYENYAKDPDHQKVIDEFIKPVMEPGTRAAIQYKIEKGAAPATAEKGAVVVTAEILSKQNSETSQAILTAYASDPAFQKLSTRLCNEIMARDKDDGDKLGNGIQKAVEKGVLPAKVEVEPTTKVSVSGKSADVVADEIIKALGEAPKKGCVMTLQGLSGTGKGTTVAKLQEKLPKAQTWSNGNIFRSLTLLAVTWSEQEQKTLEDALQPEKLKDFCEMLEFKKFGEGKPFDVKIEGLGLKYFVSEVEKTVLKDSKVATQIPKVAEVTQGEVVKFVSGALAKMAADGINVLVEGREQTLNHIRTPHRFELVLDDTSIIGKRQAALQAGGKAWEAVKSATAEQAAVDAAIKKAIIELAG